MSMMQEVLWFCVSAIILLTADAHRSHRKPPLKCTYTTDSTSKREVHEILIIDTIFPYKNSDKPVISVNYSYPGPLIEACEGDTLVIRVINRLDSPSVIHWHGISQIGTPDMDGAVGLTQCAIPPQGEMTYRFKAEPAGTSWYHGHVLEQYVDGLFGPLIIRHPGETNTRNYDSEHILLVADWYDKQAQAELNPLYLSPNNPEGFEPLPDAIVVNGKFTQSLFIPIRRSSRVHFRIINAAAFSAYTVSIDGLPLHVNELDQFETFPYIVRSFTINVAQRVSFFVDMKELDPIYSKTGDSATNSLFLRFEAVLSMYPVDIVNHADYYKDQFYPYPVFFNPLYLAILSLDSTNSTPTYAASQPTPILPNTVTPKDTNLLAARPFKYNRHGIPNATHQLNILIEFKLDAHGINRGYLNGVTFSSAANYMQMRPDSEEGFTNDKYEPLLHQMATKPNDLRIPSPRVEARNELPTIQSDGNSHYLLPYQAVVDVCLNNTDEGEHPFHLHGHSFWIIATSDYPEAENLYKGNYIQRDVVSIPASGWAKIRFVANNPGAWLLHCHMEWHMSAGLALNLITSPEQLLRSGYTVSKSQKDLCQSLRKFDDEEKSNN